MRDDDVKDLNELGETFADMVRAAFKKAKVDWMLERLDDNHRKLVILIDRQEDYPPGRE